MTEPIIGPFAEWLERRSAEDFYAYTTMCIGLGFLADAAVFRWSPDGWDADWAPRFGAIVTIFVGLCLAVDLRKNSAWWNWLRNDSDDRIHEIETPMREAKSEAKLMQARGSSALEARAHKQKAFLSTRDAVSAERRRYWGEWTQARSATRAQARCLAVSSFVWAFGDVAFGFAACGVPKC